MIKLKDILNEKHKPGHDKEGKMAKFDAKETYEDAIEVFKMIDEYDDLPEWLEAKVTKAADYMNSVKDYLEHHHSGKNEIKEDIGFAPDPDVGKNFSMYASPKRKGSDMKVFMRAYSSNEAKKIVEGKLAMYVKEMRQLQYKLVKDWMSAAKAGAIDFFDLIRGFNTGDVNRAHSYEIKFLHGLLTKDKITNRFRSYFKGRKGKPRKDDKWGK